MQAEAGKFTRDKQDRLNILFPDQAQQQQVIEDLKTNNKLKMLSFFCLAPYLIGNPLVFPICLQPILKCLTVVFFIL